MLFLGSFELYSRWVPLIIDELTRLEDATTQSHALDYLITELEIRTAANKLKNNKSSYSDRIKNEMIKSSLNELMPIVGFHMTSLKFKLKSYQSYRDFTFTMH